jgi:hypothetical protein
MLESDTSALTQFLRTVRWPALTEQLPTFFDIAGIRHKELPLSNVYAFFFRSEAPHGLGTLFLQALIDVAKAKAPTLVPHWPALDGAVRVSREHAMEKQQRLDILVHDGANDSTLSGASFAILIENKVHHWLANDLENYIASVREPLCKIGIVLGLYEEQPVAPWLFISHAELARAVEAQLGPLLRGVNPRYLPVLLHFLEHLTSMSDNHENFARAFAFAQQHRIQLAQAQQVLAELNGQALGAAIAEAYGQEYTQLEWFDNRVSIKHKKAAPLEYIVFFGNLLDVTKTPTFAITLYARGAEDQQVAAWRVHLQMLPIAQEAQLEVLPWFPFNDLLIGREYTLAGNSIAELQEQLRKALAKDWQPLEEDWLNMSPT